MIQIGNAAMDVGSFGRGEAGKVRIGIFSSLASGFLADLLRAYVAGTWVSARIAEFAVRFSLPLMRPPGGNRYRRALPTRE